MTEPNETDGFTARRFLQFLFPFYGRAEMVQPAGAVQRNADCQSQPKAAGHIQHGVLLDEQRVEWPMRAASTATAHRIAG